MAEKTTVRHAGLPLPIPLPNTAAGGLGEPGPAPLLDAPAVDAPLASDAVLSALEQLYDAYKVEHWACMEELRALHSEFKQRGGTAVERPADAPTANGDSSDNAGPSADALAAETFRELMHALQQQQRDGKQSEEGGDPMAVDGQEQPGTSGAAQQQQQQRPARRYGDAICGYGSDGDPAAFTDAEDAVLGVGPSGRTAEAWAAGGGGKRSVVDQRQLEAWRARFKGNLGGLAALERVASASTALFLDAQGALACLCGRGGRYLIRRTAVTLGRSTDVKGEVDVDLAKEGPAARVSRLQAQVALGRDGTFSVKNVGRRGMMVNGEPLERGQSAPLPHLALLEVGGLRLLFMVNPLAVTRTLARVEQLVM